MQTKNPKKRIYLEAIKSKWLNFSEDEISRKTRIFILFYAFVITLTWVYNEKEDVGGNAQFKEKKSSIIFTFEDKSCTERDKIEKMSNLYWNKFKNILRAKLYPPKLPTCEMQICRKSH